MALLTENKLRALARERTSTFAKSLESMLSEHVQEQEHVRHHDVFLSHAYDDRELAFGAAKAIEALGYSVYLDWRDDPKLDRKNVTVETAAHLRSRMINSRALFYSTTSQASSSKWMPWELGFKDGNNTRVAILPVAGASTYSEDYRGQEYLGIYPYISDGKDKTGRQRLWVHRSPSCYITFDSWLDGGEPSQR